MPDHLIDHHDARVAALESALGDARAVLSDAQRENDAVRAAEQETAAALGAARREEAAVRKALATAGMPAEVDALGEELETALIAVRAAQGESLDVGERRKRAEIAHARAQARLEEVRRALERARGERDYIAAAHDEWEGWRSAVDEPPVSSLPADAADATDPAANPHFADARDRIEADIPTELLTFARARGSDERQRLLDERAAVEGAEDALVTELQTSGGVPGAADAAEILFLRSEEALRRLVVHGAERLDRARRVFQTIAAAPPLPAAISDRIQDDAVADPARTAIGDRPAAATARDDAQADVDAKQAELDARIAAVEGAGDDPESDPQVATLRSELATLEETRDDRQADLDALDDAIDRWEATVPDSTWRQLAAFDGAVEELAELAAIDPAAVRTAFDEAEQTLFDALTEADRHERDTRSLGDALLDQQHRVAAMVGQRDAQVLSAVRGDVP